MSNNKQLFDKYLKRVSPLKEENNIDAIYGSLLNGKNSYLRVTKKGSTHFDPSWISKIEDCLYELGEIINNPREVTTVDSNVVPIELAKKVDGSSVQHLASHTQYIKEVNESGGVVPSKILSHSNIDDIHTYENRFIATFIRRLVLFVEKRYEFIRENVNLTTDDIMIVKNKSIVNGQEVEIETKVTVKKQENDKSTVDTKDYIERIKLMREYVTYYYTSPFMREMKNERNVRKPILQTNIIRKNPLYRKCFETFLFIENFDSLGVSYHLDENYQEFDEKQRKELNYLLLSDYLSIKDESEYDSIKKTSKTYKPRILTSIDDEKFTYGDIVKGPIEFVRVDDTYREYLNSKVNNNLPTHPNKYEKDFYKEDYQYKNERKLDEKELDQLIARKRKEIALYEKIIEELIARRDREEAEEKRRELEAIKEYERGLIELKRQKIIEAALKEQTGPTEEEKAAQEATQEAQVEEIKEEKEPTNIYRVADGEETVRFVDGHKEETFTLIDREYVEELPSEEDFTMEEPQESPVVEETPVEEVQEEEPIIEEVQVVEEIPQEEPIVVEPVEETVEETNEPVQFEEVPHESNEIVYYVSADSIVNYVDGHKEETYMVIEPDYTQESDIEEIAEVPLEEPVSERVVEEEPVEEETPVVEEAPVEVEEAPIEESTEGPIYFRIVTDNENGLSSDVYDGIEYFIVLTEEGYYVNENEYSQDEYDAMIFTDLDEASAIIDRLGGQVLKL